MNTVLSDRESATHRGTQGGMVAEEVNLERAFERFRVALSMGILTAGNTCSKIRGWNERGSGFLRRSLFTSPSMVQV
jgi:hypothetical protein